MKKRILTIPYIIIAFLLALSSFILIAVNAKQTDTYKKSDVFSPVIGVLDNGGFVDEFDFDNKFYTASTVLSESTCPVPVSDNGVAVFAKSGVMEFKYNNVIDLRNFGKEDSIIELFPYIGEVDGSGNRSQYARVSHITFMLTDTENPNNYVGLHFEEQGSNSAIYSRVLFNGNDMSCSWDSNGTKIIRNGEFGVYAQNGSSFGHMNITGTTLYEMRQGEMNPFTFHFDYANKYVYSNNIGHGFKNGEISSTSFRYSGVLDLDDEGQVGIGKAWSGFEKDTAYLSVKVEFSESITTTKKGGVIVKSIVGNNLDGDLSSDISFPAPTIKNLYDEYDENLPEGAVGVEYPIPSVFASDYFYGVTDEKNIDVKVYKKVGDDYTQSVYSCENGGVFTPTTAGEYKVIYKAKNVKHSSIYERFFRVNETPTPISISLASEPKEMRLRSYFTIPEIVTDGGSGNLKSIEKLYYNGLEVDFSSDRRIFIDKAGAINLKVETVGYIGEPVVKNFLFNIDDNVMLEVENVPRAIMGGNQETIKLPKAKAYNISNNQEIPVTIKADGNTVPENGEIKTSKTSGYVTVVYSAGAKSESYKLKVLYTKDGFTPVSYANAVGNATLDDSSDGIEIHPTKSGDGLQWLYPIITGFSSETTTIKLRNVAGKANYDYIDLNFEDYSNPQKSVFIRVAKNRTIQNSSIITVNGVGKEVQYNVGLDVDNNILDLYISNNALYTRAGYQLCDFSNIYDAELSIFSITFGGIEGDSAIALQQLGNQSMLVITNKWRDAFPLISFASPVSKTQIATKGSTVNIPASYAYDLNSSVATISVQVRDSNGKEILRTDDLANGASFVVNELGFYNVTFSLADGNGTSGKTSFVIQVIDGINPVITIDKLIANNIKSGSSVKIPTATATDDLDGDCSVMVFVRYLPNYATTKVEMGKDFNFNKSGKYEIIYNASDLSGNYTYYSYVVEVK